MKAIAISGRYGRNRITAEDRKLEDALWQTLLGDHGLCEPCGGNDAIAKKSEPVEFLKFGSDNEYRLRAAITEEDRLKCWNLVHKEYVARGYASDEEFPYRYSIHDAMPDTLTLLVEKNHEVVGTVTGIPDSRLGLPAEAIYGSELNAMRRSGCRIFEVGRFAISRTYQNQRRILTSLMDILTIYARRVWRATDFVITVNPSHVKYYERMLMFKQRGDLKALDSVQGAPAMLLTLDLGLEEKVRRYAHGEGPKPEGYSGRRMLHQYSSNMKEEEIHARNLKQLSRRPDKDFLRRYFMWVRPLIAQLSEEHRGLFERWYPGLLDDALVKEVSAA